MARFSFRASFIVAAVSFWNQTASAQTETGAAERSRTASSSAVAADAAEGANASPADGDIVVTARKRDETVQRVPIAITVVSDRALAATGAASLLQIQSVAPGVNFAKAPTGTEIGITIRGLGSAPGAPSFDSSVSLFVDGIFAPRAREFASSMFDVQRIEVIKGTQAALLGKNTSLGAINLITRKPGDRLAANARANYEVEANSWLVTGGIDVPVTETLAVRVAGEALSDKGWVRNVLNDRLSPRVDTYAARLVAVWRPGANVTLTALAQHDSTTLDGSPAEFVSLNARALLLQSLAGAPGTLDASMDRRNAESLGGLGSVPHESLRFDRFGLTGDLGLGPVKLTAVTAYSRYTDRNFTDPDFQAGDYQVRYYNERSSNFSQELRVVSQGTGPLDFVLGGLFIRNTLRIRLDNGANYPFGPAPGVLIVGRYLTSFDQTTTTGSFFGQATLRLLGGLRATGGMRYTLERKEVDLARTAITPGFFSLTSNPPFAPFSLDRRDTPFDYSGGLQYDLAPNVMVYASYGKGTKSGGFASTATRLDRSEYSSETAGTMEAGVKTQDGGRRWLLNLAVFDTRVDDFQVVTFNGSAFNIFNTDLKSRGVEVEAYWYPVQPIRLFVNNTYADAKDRNTGLAIPLAPRWSGSGGFAMRTPMSGGLDLMFDGAVDYRSSRTYQQVPTAATVSPPFTTLNLSLAVARHDDAWEVRVIGRNLTDEIAPAFAFPTPTVGTQSVIPERGRTIAFQVSGRF